MAIGVTGGRGHHVSEETMVKFILIKISTRVMKVVLMTTLMMTSYLDVREDMERGLLLSRGSVPTGGLC